VETIGLQRLHVLFFIELSSRRVHLAGCTLEHPVRHDNRGTVKVVDSNGIVRALSDEWANAGGIAWHPGRDEIWFTASQDGTPKSLWATTLSGHACISRQASCTPGVSLNPVMSPVSTRLRR
jgi:hypothetical protein